MKRAPVQLSLTPKEMRTLVEMAYISEWVVNGDSGPADPKFNKAVEAVARKIYGTAIESKVPTDVDFDEKSGEYITDGMVLDSDAAHAIKAYDKGMFDEILIRELFTHAAIREVTEKKWNKMHCTERLKLAGHHEERIRKAFEKYGLDAIYVMSPEPAE